MTLSLNSESNNEYLPPESTNGTNMPRDAFGQPREVDNPSISRDTLVSIPSTPRKRRLLPLTLSIFYTLLMLFFWVVTAILCLRPIKGSGWYDSYSFFEPCYFQDGVSRWGFLCKERIGDIGLEVTVNDRWRRMARMIGSILSVAAVPISSAICSRGAVVYLQNRKERSFALHKAIVIADKGWSDPNLLCSVFLSRKNHKEINQYLLLSTCICALGSFPILVPS
jgi:hypothetical protein